MEYETEEQQVEALKAWWAENGRAVITGVVLGAAVIGGWTFWQSREEAAAIAASDSFSRTMTAINSSDHATAASLADELQSDQPDNLYSSYANFAAARADVENNDLESAAKRLKWVVDNAPQADVKMIAQVRLARVQGALGDAAAGLSSLPSSFPESFTGMVEEARGDLLVMQGDTDAARTAYEAAQESQYVSNRDGLMMKLNELATPSAS
ncbi:MAG: YfgM family protein [Granulosicoccus sp.]